MKKEQNYRRFIRILISVIMIITGIALLAVFVDCEDKIWQTVVFNIGVALVVAGVVALFNELLFGNDYLFNEKKLSGGLQMVAEERQKFSGYYNWTRSTNPKILKFSGHAVLKSMSDGIDNSSSRKFIETIIDKLKEGTKIYVLFFDPMFEAVEHVTTGMIDVNKRVLYERLKAALEITKELQIEIKKIIKQDKTAITGELHISLVGVANNQYAYHYVEYEDNIKEVYVGFYFLGGLGGGQPVFTIDDTKILSFFDKNFEGLYHHATTKKILSIESGTEKLFSDILNDRLKHVNAQLDEC